ncbi:30S ribosomal protein S20 [Candidatus Poribacteria bacterium]|nr:30S ribosomal protein S20 [Candidatus Poribacteria bacterium]
MLRLSARRPEEKFSKGVFVLHRQSAKKHARADKAKRNRNRHRKATLRTVMKQAEIALAEGNVETAQELCRTTTSLLDRAASKGVIKKGTANRQKSRLISKLHALTAEAA